MLRVLDVSVVRLKTNHASIEQCLVKLSYFTVKQYLKRILRLLVLHGISAVERNGTTARLLMSRRLSLVRGRRTIGGSAITLIYIHRRIA